MPKCKKIALSQRKIDEKQHTAFCVGCGKWDCDDCAKVNVRRFVARVIYGLQSLKETAPQWYMWTITVRAGDRGFLKSVKIWRVSWRKLYYELKNEQKRQNWGLIHLVRVYEKHKDGTLHVHVISNQNLQSSKDAKSAGGFKFKPEYKVKRRNGTVYYRSAWLEDKAKKSGLGYICECRPIVPIKDGNVEYVIASYVAKYMAKSDLSGYPKGFHRVEFSQKFPHLPKMTTGEITAFSPSQWLNDDMNDWELIDKTTGGLLGEIMANYAHWLGKGNN